MVKGDVAREFKRKLARFYGYDESFHFVRRNVLEGCATGLKVSLLPRDFLNYAIEDSTSLENEKNRVNCLSNSKRATDSQIDRLVWALGFLPLARKQRWNVPKKIGFINDMGLVAPRILRRLNKLRNRLEHEYATPSKREVEDALDVTMLFISYAELVHVPSLNWALSDKMAVRYDYDKMLFHFYEGDPDKCEDPMPLESLAYGDDGFLDFHDFLARIVPLMQKKTDSGEDIEFNRKASDR